MDRKSRHLNGPLDRIKSREVELPRFSPGSTVCDVRVITNSPVVECRVTAVISGRRRRRSPRRENLRIEQWSSYAFSSTTKILLHPLRFQPRSPRARCIRATFVPVQLQHLVVCNRALRRVACTLRRETHKMRVKRRPIMGARAIRQTLMSRCTLKFARERERKGARPEKGGRLRSAIVPRLRSVLGETIDKVATAANLIKRARCAGTRKQRPIWILYTAKTRGLIY